MHQMPDQPAAGQCCNVMSSTAATGTLEADDSPVKDKIGYVAAPVKDTESSPGSTPGPGAPRRQGRTRMRPSSSWPPGLPSQDYEETVARGTGLAARPAPLAPRPTRTPTTRRPPRRSTSRPRRPSTPPIRRIPVCSRATLGVRLVIPVADLATGVSEDISSAIAGRTTVDKALQKGQKEAEKVEQVQEVIYGGLGRRLSRRRPSTRTPTAVHCCHCRTLRPSPKGVMSRLSCARSPNSGGTRAHIAQTRILECS